MSDGDKTNPGKCRAPMPALTLTLAWSLAALPCLAAPGPALQELAGASRTDASLLASSAMEEHPEVIRRALVPPIPFSLGSATLTPSTTRILDRLGRLLAAPGSVADRIRVEGHPDAIGGINAGRDLAGRRAQAVAAYLVQNCNVAVARLDVVPSARRVLAGRVVVMDLGAQ